MLTEQERKSTIDFYTQQIEQIATRNILLFLEDKSIGYVALGDECDYLHFGMGKLPATISNPNDVYRLSDLPEEVRIKRPDSNIVPAAVIESFNRHTWYSRYCLTDIRLVTFDVDGCKTFALYIEGYNGDGCWDNHIYAWEIYEITGDFVCSLIKIDQEDEWQCKESLITDKDFVQSLFLPLSPPPPYTLELIAQSSSPIWVESDQYGGLWTLPLWSEEEATIVE